MPYRFQVQRPLRLVVIVFDGVVDAGEEKRALADVTGSREFEQDFDILVDRRTAPLMVGPADVDPHLAEVHRRFTPTGKPKLAILVSSQHDFGMIRMLELQAGDEALHEIRPFRELGSACDWLGVHADEIVWPSA